MANRRLIILFSLLAALLLLATTPGGALDGPDSVSYVHAARDLRAGLPMRGYHGDPYVQWGPLYPILLSIWNDPYTGARWYNALAIAVTMGLTLILGSSFLSRRMLIAVGFAVLLGPPILPVYQMAISEPLFIVFVLMFLWAVTRLEQRGSLALLTISVTLALLQRLVGVILIPLGIGLVFWLERQHKGKALRDAILFALLPSLAYIAWGLYGIWVSGRAGPPATPIYNLYEATLVSFYTIVQWIPTVLLPMIVVVLIALWRRRKHARTWGNRSIFSGVSQHDDRSQHADSGVVSQ
ncbi:MAG TPA: hypothetical protein VHD90_05400 [Phototrophicaceae bacterium]|nr:hypothetical protein [Phototrophicaceae bacterium]